MSDRLLDLLMSQILVQMSLLSEQAGRSYDGITVHGGEKDRLPHLSEKPLVDFFRDRYNGAHSVKSKREVIEAALAALKEARRQKIPEGQPPTPDSLQWRRWVAESPESSRELARLFGCSHQYILQIRQKYAA